MNSSLKIHYNKYLYTSDKKAQANAMNKWENFIPDLKIIKYTLLIFKDTCYNWTVFI